MGLFRRQYQIRLHQPVTGSARTIQSLPSVAHQTPLMRIQPAPRWRDCRSVTAAFDDYCIEWSTVCPPNRDD